MITFYLTLNESINWKTIECAMSGPYSRVYRRNTIIAAIPAISRQISGSGPLNLDISFETTDSLIDRCLLAPHWIICGHASPDQFVMPSVVDDESGSIVFGFKNPQKRQSNCVQVVK
jgi:hypothetical protein